MNNKITISYKIAIDFTSLRAAFFQQRNWIKFWNSKTLSKAFTDHFPQSSCRFPPVPSRPFRHPCKWHFRVLVSPSLYTVNRSIVRSQLLWNSYRMDDTTTRLNCHLPPIFSSTHSLTGHTRYLVGDRLLNILSFWLSLFRWLPAQTARNSAYPPAPGRYQKCHRIDIGKEIGDKSGHEHSPDQNRY